jgi:serine protease Do
VRIYDVAKLTPQDRAALKLPDDARGALVESLTPKGPAAVAGLRPGDIIESFEGKAVDRNSLQWQASTAGVGRVVALHVSREGKPLDVSVKLGELEEQTGREE